MQLNNLIMVAIASGVVGLGCAVTKSWTGFNISLIILFMSALGILFRMIS